MRNRFGYLKYLIGLFFVFFLFQNFSFINSNQPYNELLDYLIQDVCVDQKDNVISGDPAICQNHRDISRAEKFPYLVSDMNLVNGERYQANFSYPVLSADGNLRILTYKDLQGNLNANYKFSAFSKSNSGFDLIDLADSQFASFIRTSDGGCYDQLWSKDGSPSNRPGGWILFPLNTDPSNFPHSSFIEHMTYNIPISKDRPANCQGGSSKGITYWNRPADYTFESGKKLKAIKSYHFASSSLNAANNALEMYYFSREYGFTRWEAWIPQSRCFTERGSSNPLCYPQNANYPLKSRCQHLNVSSTGVPGLDTWGGQNWVRVDCRDTTFYLALNTPTLPLDKSMAQTNGVVDIDFAGTVAPAIINQQGADTPALFFNPGKLTLEQGQRVGDEHLFLAMQTDGNLVLYVNYKAVWSSGTTGKCQNCFATFQADGNFVIYNQYKPIWNLKSNGATGLLILDTVPYLRTITSADPLSQSTSISRRTNTLKGNPMSYFGFNEEFITGYAYNQGFKCPQCSVNVRSMDMKLIQVALDKLSSQGVHVHREIVHHLGFWFFTLMNGVTRI